MAPREATGTFPDQYLTFDYDSILPMGLGQQQQQQQQQQPHDHPIPTVAAAEEDEGVTVTGPPPLAPLNHGHDNSGAARHNNSFLFNSQSNPHTIHASSSANANANAGMMDEDDAAAAVDPLSIDPTMGDDDEGAVSPSVESLLALPSSNNNFHSSFSLRPTPSLGTANTGTATSEARSRLPIHSSTFHNANPTNATNATTTPAQAHAVSPSLSTGSSSVFYSTTASMAETPHSPLMTSPPASSVSFLHPWSSPQQQPSRNSTNTNHFAFLGQSVLDAAGSMESDDDDDDGISETGLVPSLERTFESGISSSYFQLDASGHLVVSVDDPVDTDDDDDEDDDEELTSPFSSLQDQQQQQQQQMGALETSSVDSSESLRMIYRNTAFDGDDPQSPVYNSNNNNRNHAHHPPPLTGVEGGAGHGGRSASRRLHATPTNSMPQQQPPTSPTSIMLSFGPNTTVADLKYFAERGCIVALLQALTTPRLLTLGTRMLADYAKMSHRRVAVASNRRILEFVQKTMVLESTTSTTVEQQQQSSSSLAAATATGVDWLGREYAVETVRSLTATEESDRHLMKTQGLLQTLALVASGGPFVTSTMDNGVRCTVPLASEKARLHACIAIMNLSCGKANKIEIAKIPQVLEAMRDVMLHSSDEARLKATTCIKNLSNADANDSALLGTAGLLEALGQVSAMTCSPETGATPCTTNACLALMNLSISKTNKHRVFRTPGVMDSLMTVLERTTAQGSSTEARIKACSALSNLAIGYDNKIPMFHYPGFVDSILNVIQTDTGEARTKACSILWSFAAEMKNQEPVVQRGDILPVLVRVAEEDGTTEARFKCVAALTLLAESLGNAIPLLEAGALVPLMEILHDAGPDPTQWKGQTASWCVGFLMNIAQSDEAVPSIREAGVVELLAPLLTLDHYQSLKAAMAVTFCCRYDEGDECYDLLRKTENVIPKIISLLHNTLSGRGGNGYKYGVFTLRSSVGCIDALASGPEFMKESIATGPVFESLLRVVHDFCVDGGTPGAIVGGGRDDALSATLAVRALQSLTGHLIPVVGSSSLPFAQSLEKRLLVALASFETSTHNEEITEETRRLATDAKIRIQGGRKAVRSLGDTCHLVQDTEDVDMGDVASLASNCCGFQSLPGLGKDFLHALALPNLHKESASAAIMASPSIVEKDSDEEVPVRTFLLTDASTGRRFVVPSDPTGGRQFYDCRAWCFRRGRFCMLGENSDPTYVWSSELQQAYEVALATQRIMSSESSGMDGNYHEL